MSLRLFILEDEGPALARLLALLAEAAPGAVVAGTADSVRAGAEWLGRHPAPDLILADIQLSDGLSLDLFRARSPGCPVVFTTAHDTFLLEAFATHGIAYLLKPIKVADLAAALQKHRDLARLYTAGVVALTQQLAGTRTPGPAAPRRRFLAQKGIAFQPVPVDEVAYFFSEHKLTFLVTHRAQRHLVNESLATLEAELAPRHVPRRLSRRRRFCPSGSRLHLPLAAPMNRSGLLNKIGTFEVGPTQNQKVTQPNMSSPITLQIESAVVRRYESAARQLRKQVGAPLPKVEDLIHRELSHRTASGIVEDFLQSDWRPSSRRSQPAIRTRKAVRRGP